MTQDEVFNALVDNAFDFMEKSTDEIENEPKYALIHFCAAVELFLKARLMKEDWKLIVNNPNLADWDAFVAGELFSVNMKKANDRLRDNANDELPVEEFNCFDNLSKHRNKLIHFHHPGGSSKEELREQVASEQVHAWYYLHRRLTGSWRKYFTSIADKLDLIEKKIQKVREYLEVKFNGLKDEFDQLKQQGKAVTNCPSCKFDSLVGEKGLHELISNQCKVCDHNCLTVNIHCPACDHPVALHDDGFGTCEECQNEFEPVDIAEILNPHSEHIAAREGDDELLNGNCSYCDSLGTLIPYSTSYLCTSCYELFQERWICSYCGEFTNIENNPALGCIACKDAREEWIDKH